MNLIDTAKPDRDKYARTPEGKINYGAYVGLDAEITENGLTIETRIVGARARYGHLDLEVTPISGCGTRWVEYKNVSIAKDPALASLASTVVESNTHFVPQKPLENIHS
jgi:hypothetical protein